MSNKGEAILRNQTLSGPAQEALAARRLRQGDGQEEEKAEEDQPGRYQSLRMKMAAAKRALDLKEKTRQMVENKVVSPVNQATGRMLRWAWLAIIPSFGSSILWINLHVFLSFVFGERLFCKLGHEWLPLAEAKSISGRATGDTIGIAEKMGLIFLDLLIFFIIFGIIAIIVWLANSIIFKTVDGITGTWEWITNP